MIANEAICCLVVHTGDHYLVDFRFDFRKQAMTPSLAYVAPLCPTFTPSCWMEEALQILQTSHNFNDIRLICKYVPSLDPGIAAALLSKRRKGWLDAFLKVLCRREAIEEPPCDSLLSTADAIVAMIKRRSLLPALAWNGAWIFPDLNSSARVSIIAEKLDGQIHSTFSSIAFEDWLAWVSGFPNDPIQSLLNETFTFRNDLARYIQQHATTMGNKLQLLQQASLSSRIRYTTYIE